MNLHHHPDDTDAAVSSQELIQRLRELEKDMPEALHARFLEAGEDIVPDLLAVIEEVSADDEVDYGWAPLHAAELLGALGDAQAVPVLLRCLVDFDVLEALHQRALHALIALGNLAVDACLEAYAATTDDSTRDSIAEILSRCGTRDERIYEVLLDSLQRSPELAANFFVDYGDPRAIPALSQLFDTLPVSDEETPFANQVFIELRGAIEELGGQLTAEQTAKARRADAPRRRLAAQMRQAINRIATHQNSEPTPPISAKSGAGTVVRKQRKIGRNEPCWCGSGKKYKRCHLILERR